MKPGAFLVTGGTSGIGAAIARTLVQGGHRVGIVARSEPEPPFDWLQADLADGDGTTAAIRSWLERIDRPANGLVLCAADYGVAPRHPLMSSHLAEFDGLCTVNLRSQVVVLSAMLPSLMGRPRSVILAITSDAAFAPAPGRALYAATKAGSLALLASLAEELTDSGVSVIKAFPRSQVRTPGLEARRPPGFVFEGYASPNIFEPIATHLASTLGQGMNGSVLVIDNHGVWQEVAMVACGTGKATSRSASNCSLR
jgi:NAD(P)-dependent dehydrogenase (short-subunit alcohol dehydrogenase family)